MAETKKITTLYVVTDTETNQEKIGDIDGGMFDKIWLKKHIKNYGTAGLIKTLAYMNNSVIEMEMLINRECGGNDNKCGNP